MLLQGPVNPLTGTLLKAKVLEVLEVDVRGGDGRLSECSWWIWLVIEIWINVLL